MVLRKLGEQQWTGCTYLAQDRYHWQAFVNTVMNVYVP
jgi:hypothetical protein